MSVGKILRTFGKSLRLASSGDMLSETGVAEDPSPAGCSRYVVGKTVLDIAKQSAAFIFRVKQSGQGLLVLFSSCR